MLQCAMLGWGLETEVKWSPDDEHHAAHYSTATPLTTHEEVHLVTNKALVLCDIQMMLIWYWTCARKSLPTPLGLQYITLNQIQAVTLSMLQHRHINVLLWEVSSLFSHPGVLIRRLTLLLSGVVPSVASCCCGVIVEGCHSALQSCYTPVARPLALISWVILLWPLTETCCCCCCWMCVFVGRKLLTITTKFH